MVEYFLVSLCTHDTVTSTFPSRGSHCGWAMVTMLPESSRALVLMPEIHTGTIGGAVLVCAQQEVT